VKIQEILNELSFFGSPCTKDCSGHMAGFNWANKHNSNVASATPSRSFNNGTAISIDHKTKNRKPSIKGAIRDTRGKYTKFNPQPKTNKR
jgi:hypothetical protein